jgi:hypothetical protein
LIETILADLTASTEIGKLVIFGFIGGLGILALAGTKYDTYAQDNGLATILAVLGIVVLFVTLIFTLNQLGSEIEMKDEINRLHMENIMALSCSEIRNDLLVLLADKSKKKDKTVYEYKQRHFEWEQDYYYTKCEIPLRDEVLKLQDPAFEVPMEIIEEVVKPIVENNTEGFKSDYTGYGKQYEDWD